jgi:hypothetical protein
VTTNLPVPPTLSESSLLPTEWLWAQSWAVAAPGEWQVDVVMVDSERSHLIAKAAACGIAFHIRVWGDSRVEVTSMPTGKVVGRYPSVPAALTSLCRLTPGEMAALEIDLASRREGTRA